MSTLITLYESLDGTGRVSRTGLLEVKAAYDILGERMRAERLSSSGGGCNAGCHIFMVIAVIMGAALISGKH